ncbi:MAG: hypothetical protein P8Z30_06960 [Acidobacteriota bacterium]|jgi:hypothetical protein
MKPWSPLTIGLVAGAGAILIGAGVVIFLKLRRKKDPAELERLRRIGLGRTGRITAGEIVGLIEPEGENAVPLQLVYRYEIAGVSYKVAQDVSTMPRVAAVAARLMGRAVSAKYDVKHPSNSIVVCEEWSGIRGIDLRQPEAAEVPPPLDAQPVEQGGPQSGG